MARPEGKYAWTVTVGTKILGDKDQGMAIPPKNQFSDFFGKIFGK